jgi:hypothetical protein
MNETNKEQNQMAKKKTSYLASRSLLSFIFCLIFIVMAFGSYNNKNVPLYIVAIFIGCIVFFSLAAAITGDAGIISILFSKGKKRRIVMCLPGAMLTLVWIGAGIDFYGQHIDRVRIKNLESIRIALCVYESKYKKLPRADKWCDLLVEKGELNPEILRFKGLPDDMCGYAFNKNLDGHSILDCDIDAIVVFEAKGPWNLVGGPELLDSKRHFTGKYGFVFGIYNEGLISEEYLEKVFWEAYPPDYYKNPNSWNLYPR